MRLVTYNRNKESRIGVLLDKTVVDVQLAYQKYCDATSQSTMWMNSYDSMLELLKAGEESLKVLAETIQFVRTKTPQAKDVIYKLEEVELLAPLTNPGKVICIGANFPASGKLTAPDYPIIFLKPASTITGPGKPVWVFENTANVAYEVELVVVIGSRAHKVETVDAAKYIAGFALANDLGDRVLEKRTSQWTSGKMFDSFTPLGPIIVTPDEIMDTHNLLMGTWVNDQQVQKGNTGEMFFDVEYLVSYISTLTSLEPGDIILTGSPKLMNGEPAPSVTLKPGDVVRIYIDGLGELINPIQAEPR